MNDYCLCIFNSLIHAWIVDRHNVFKQWMMYFSTCDFVCVCLWILGACRRFGSPTQTTILSTMQPLAHRSVKPVSYLSLLGDWSENEQTGSQSDENWLSILIQCQWISYSLRVLPIEVLKLGVSSNMLSWGVVRIMLKKLKRKWLASPTGHKRLVD